MTLYNCPFGCGAKPEHTLSDFWRWDCGSQSDRHEACRQWQSPECKRRLAEASGSEMIDAFHRILDLLEQFPSGIDREADPDDECPDDAFAFLGGLIWQECIRWVEGDEEGGEG